MAHPASKQQDALTQLTTKAVGSRLYTGDVTPAQAFDYLRDNEAVLVDVRTPSEWQAGQPDLSTASSKMLSLSWKTEPDYQLNPLFVDGMLQAQIDRDTPIFFMCRGGGRSAEAASAMIAAGYRYCFNIRGGFEGKPDAQGWKTSSLPWK